MGVVKVIGIGDGLGVMLTDEALATLNAKAGDELRLETTETGEIVLYVEAPDRAARLERGRAFIRKYRPTFEALAK